MRSKKIVLIGFQEQDNLGIGYLAAMLINKGFQVEVLDFREDTEVLYKTIRLTSPLLVGFSIIFQYYVQKFVDLVTYLREHNITCHFCAGGHYPSLRPEELLNIIPGLNSVVRFEGEYTLVDFVQKIYKGEDWRNTLGITYRKGSQIIANKLRPLVDNLDVLPFPVRIRFPISCLGKNYSTILASRGCVRNCAFCSIRRFYKTPPGKTLRIRSPANVVEEMKMLHENYNTCIFFFQDDDFPILGSRGRRWVYDFIVELEHNDLADKFLWKISCRPDEVSDSLFKEMKRAGLFLVYLGIESGNETGLKVLNKGYTVDQNFRAVNILKNLEILYDFGFMLFDPSSTFESVNENIHFLRELCGDGSSPTGFCKMIPYAATDIEEQLLRQNRLKGAVQCRDYDFFDVRLNKYYSFLRDTFGQWVFTNDGLFNRLKWARYEIAVIEKYFPGVKDLDFYKIAIKNIVAISNGIFFTIAEELSKVFSTWEIIPPISTLTEYQQILLSEQQRLLFNMKETIESFYLYNNLPFMESKIQDAV